MNPATVGKSPVCGGCLVCIGCTVSPMLAFLTALAVLKSQYH